jgi:hypothetical protein
LSSSEETHRRHRKGTAAEETVGPRIDGARAVEEVEGGCSSGKTGCPKNAATTTMTTTMTPKNAATMTTMIMAMEKSGKEKGCSDKGNNDDGGKGKAKVALQERLVVLRIR